MGHWYTEGQLASGRRDDLDREAARSALRSEARAAVKAPVRPVHDRSWWVRLKGLGWALAHVAR